MSAIPYKFSQIEVIAEKDDFSVSILLKLANSITFLS